jgi:hypothetical protein
VSGHGHVTPNADGSKARCGGPAICPTCAIEAGTQKVKESKSKPPDSASCGDEACGHTFGAHFVTFDGKNLGCSVKDEGPRGDTYPCECDGYAIVHRWAP